MRQVSGFFCSPEVTDLLKTCFKQFLSKTVLVAFGQCGKNARFQSRIGIGIDKTKSAFESLPVAQLYSETGV